MTQLLPADAQGMDRAAAILRDGGLVALPTETVYGLGADARNDMAVARIFAAKDRPSFNPLIVHLADVAQAKHYVEWNDMADRLASAFWPGPLTLVLPLRAGSGIAPLVTAGLPSLAVRVPAHPLAHDLLARFGGPIAAPSANLSGQISPTRPEHVLSGLDGRIDAVLDGGACEVGLESTILSLDPNPMLLRPGGLPVEAIEQCLGARLAQRGAEAAITAPGQIESHYAPRAPLRLNAHSARPGERLLGFGATPGAEVNLSPAGDLTEAAARLFASLHALDRAGTAPIAVAPIPDHGLGRAINDRLRRAAAPRGSGPT